MNILKLSEEPTSPGIRSLGALILGFLGYHLVGLIVLKCVLVKNTNALFQRVFGLKKEQGVQAPHETHWWSKITGSKEFIEFQKNWIFLAKSSGFREEVADHLKALHRTIPHYSKGKYYGALLGTVWHTPGNFGMWMRGVALVGAYLKEKKKIEGLFVCETLEALIEELKKIQENPEDQRLSFVVGGFCSGYKNNFSFGFERNFPQHKAAVCVEKRGGHLSLALLDADPFLGNKEISSNHLEGDLWEGYEEHGQFNSQELVFRAILKGCSTSKLEMRFLHSQVLREKTFGCAVFALQDAIAFLQNKDFFQQVKCKEEKLVKVHEGVAIEVITHLPPEFMKGTQSSLDLEAYLQNKEVLDVPLPGNKKTLRKYFDMYRMEVRDEEGETKLQNHYVTKKAFKYLYLVSLALKHLKKQEINAIIESTLIPHPQRRMP